MIRRSNERFSQVFVRHASDEIAFRGEQPTSVVHGFAVGRVPLGVRLGWNDRGMLIIANGDGARRDDFIGNVAVLKRV